MKTIRKYGVTTALTYGEREWIRKTAESKDMTASAFIRHVLDFYKSATGKTTTED